MIAERNGSVHRRVGERDPFYEGGVNEIEGMLEALPWDRAWGVSVEDFQERYQVDVETDEIYEFSPVRVVYLGQLMEVKVLSYPVVHEGSDLGRGYVISRHFRAGVERELFEYSPIEGLLNMDGDEATLEEVAQARDLVGSIGEALEKRRSKRE